jgi:glycosyltransferase involved in cell wall biosynthesis
LRILFVNHAAYRSGAENSLLYLVKGLSHWEYELFAVCPPGPVEALLQAAGVQVTAAPLAKQPFQLAQAITLLTREIRRNQIDLIHANSVDATQFCAVPALLSRKPLIGHIRNIAPYRPHGLWLLKQARRLIAVSQATANSLIAQGMPDHKVTTIYNGVDSDAYCPRPYEREQSRRRFGLPLTAPLVGAVGRLHPIKGYDDFIQAAHTMLQQVPAVHFVIAGSDPLPDQTYFHYLCQQVEKLGLGDRFHFLGEVDDIAHYLQGLDVFVLPSHEEPFARAILEAMSCGCPIVATAVGGVPEAIQHESNGLLVPSATPDALAAAIRRLLVEPSLAEKMGQNARNQVIKQFSLTANISHTINLYNEIITS